MKRELIISILLTGLGLLGCGNPPGSPVINDLLVNDLLFNDSISKVAFFSIPADSITTIAIKDSIPSLTAGGSFSFTTDHGTFLISQGSSTLAAGSQSITIVSATDTAQVLLLSGLDATDSVLVTAGNGSTFTTGRLHFSMAYPDDLIFTSSRYRIKSNDSDNATISLTLLKALGKASNHVPVNFSIAAFDSLGNPATNSNLTLDIPSQIYIDHQSGSLTVHSSGSPNVLGSFLITASCTKSDMTKLTKQIQITLTH